MGEGRQPQQDGDLRIPVIPEMTLSTSGGGPAEESRQTGRVSEGGGARNAGFSPEE